MQCYTIPKLLQFYYENNKNTTNKLSENKSTIIFNLTSFFCPNSNNLPSSLKISNYPPPVQNYSS